MASAHEGLKPHGSVKNLANPLSSRPSYVLQETLLLAMVVWCALTWDARPWPRYLIQPRVKRR